MFNYKNGNKIKSLKTSSAEIIKTIRFTPDEKEIISAAPYKDITIINNELKNGYILKWNIITGNVVKRIAIYLRNYNIIFSPDTKYLASIFPHRGRREVEIFDTDTGKKLTNGYHLRVTLYTLAKIARC